MVTMVTWCYHVTQLTLVTGMVDPPMTMMVNSTITNVVLTITCFISSSNGRCSASANAIAPLRPVINVRDKRKQTNYW